MISSSSVIIRGLSNIDKAVDWTPQAAKKVNYDSWCEDFFISGGFIGEQFSLG